ncbi:hypothetical protein D3C72_2065170 [compost metagenome]
MINACANAGFGAFLTGATIVLLVTAPSSGSTNARSGSRRVRGKARIVLFTPARYSPSRIFSSCLAAAGSSTRTRLPTAAKREMPASMRAGSAPASISTAFSV